MPAEMQVRQLGSQFTHPVVVLYCVDRQPVLQLFAVVVRGFRHWVQVLLVWQVRQMAMQGRHLSTELYVPSRHLVRQLFVVAS